MGLIRYLKGYRTCRGCRKEDNKKNMVLVGVPDGIIDSHLAWYDIPCAKKYLQQCEKVSGPFTLIANISASFTPKRTIERLSKSQ